MNAQQIENILRFAVTDPQRIKRTDPGNPVACGVGAVHMVVTPDANVVHNKCRNARIGCWDCKRELARSLEWVTNRKEP